MSSTEQTITGFLGDVWTLGNFFGRIGIIFLFFWPVVVGWLAVNGYSWDYIYGVGMVPVAVGFLVFAAFPMFFLIAAYVPYARNVGVPMIGKAATVLGAELLWTAYCMLVPVENSSQIFLFVSMAIVASYLFSKGSSQFASNTHAILNWVVIPGLTILFYFVTPAPAEGAKEANVQTVTGPKAGSIESALEGVSNWWEGRVHEWQAKPPEMFIDLVAGQVRSIPFSPGVDTKWIRIFGFEPPYSSWETKFQIDVSGKCLEKFSDGRTFEDAPGFDLKYGPTPGVLRITGVEAGVATVSVWKEPKPIKE